MTPVELAHGCPNLPKDSRSSADPVVCYAPTGDAVTLVWVTPPGRAPRVAATSRGAALLPEVEVVSGDTIPGMAMTLRLSEADDRLLTARARREGRSKQAVAREAIHAYLTDQVRRLEDLEDELTMARYRLRRQLGEVTYVSQAEARSSLGLPPAPRRSASA